MNHRRFASLLVATLLPLLSLAFVTQSLAESAEQQTISALEAGKVAATTAHTNERAGVGAREADFEVGDLGSTNVLVDTDLGISKGDSPDPVTAGQNLTYTLTISNTGPSAASNTVVTDTLPAGVTLLSTITSLGGTCDDSADPVIVCDLGTLVVLDSVTITMVVTVDADTTGPITNQAQVGSDATDSNGDNDDATTDTDVDVEADLGIAKGDDPDPVIAGQNLTYTLTISNTGPSDATGVMVTDNLPAEVLYVSAEASTGPGCTGTDPVVCDLETVTVGQSAWITIVVSVDAGTTGPITNQAQVGSDAIDNNGDNDDASADTDVDVEADLGIAKGDSPDPVTAGQNLTYTLTISNTGPSDATGVLVTDNLPAEVQYVSAEASTGPGCTGTDPVVCDLETVTVGQSAWITIVVSVDAGTTGPITNQAQVGSDAIDNNGDNDDASADTDVDVEADLGIAKGDSPDPVTASQNLTYTLTISNTGPSDATGVMVTDNLPAEVLYVSAEASTGPGCTGTDPVVCDLETVTVGQSAWITIVVTVDADTTGMITNQAQVGSDVTDSNGDNDDASADTDVNAEADLGIAKGDSPDPVTAGQNLTYTLTISNTGPSDATGVLVTDNLPAEVQYVSAEASKGPGCTGTDPVVCDLETVTVGQSAWITIVVSVDAGTTGPITNQAQVGSDAIDNNGDNDDASADTDVDVEADLGIAKGDSPDPVTAGQNLTYTLTISNIGPSDATGVLVTDNLPAEVQYVSAEASKGPGCTGTDPVVCDLETVTVGQSAWITIVVSVDAGTTGPITNQAQVGSDAIDNNGDNDDASADTDVDVEADLGIAKGDSPDPVTASKNLTYTLTVNNIGPSDATGVMVTDNLPAEVQYVSAEASTGPGCTGTDPVVCDLETVTVGQSAWITIVVSVDAGTTGPITNQAQVGSDAIDNNGDNDDASADTDVDVEADLGIAKGDSPDPVTAGQNLTYTLTISNTGPSDATGVMVTDTLPAEALYVSAVASKGPGCTGTDPVVCDLETVIVDQSAWITIVVTVDADTTGPITNQAQVGSDVTDSNGDNDDASADTDVNAEADLGIAKGDSPDPVTAGQNLTYTLTVSNTGPSDAAGVMVTDTLPAEVQYVSAEASKGPGCTGTDPVVCDLETVIVGQSAWITIVVSVDVGTTGPITNQAQVGSDAIDNNGDNDDASADTTVNAQANLGIAKGDSPDPVIAGQNLTYTLTISNIGPSDATGVLVTDNLPAEAQDVTAMVSKGPGCTGTDPVVCDLETLTVGQSAWITIVVSLDASLAPTIIDNIAILSSGVPDPDDSNDTASTTTVVETEADLKIVKSAAPDPVTAGDQLTYMLTITNAGPSNATGVVVTDTLPAETIFESVSSSKGNPCDEGSTVVCELGVLAAGASAKITIVVTVNAATVGIIENTAEVTGEQKDPDTENNLVTPITSVKQIGALPLTKLDDPDPVVAGTNLTYTLHVSSTGPSNATSVNLTDTLPGEVNFITMTTNLGTCNHLTGTVMCDLGDMPVGTEATVEILVEVDSTALNQINNSAIISAEGVEPIQVDENTRVRARADLMVSNVAWPDPVIAGQSLTYTIAVTNIGPSLAEQVEVSNPLPTGVTFNSSPDCTLGGSTITCEFGDLGAGETISTTILVDVDPAADGTIFSAALVSSSTTDPNSSNDIDTTETKVNKESDLGIVKTGNTSEVAAGTNLTYTLIISNNGPSDATGVEVRDTVPAGVTLLSSVPSKGSCSKDVNPVVCDLGTLEASTTATITIKVLVDPETLGPLQNQAEVSSDTPDGNPANDDASEDTTVVAEADLIILKIDEPEPVTAGENLTYTLTITNIGPSDATNVIVTDTLPLGVELISAIPSQDGPCVGERTITCTLGTLNVNGSATIHVSVAVSSTQIAPLLNIADVRSSAADLDLSNNHAEEETAVVRSADLSIDVDSRPNPVMAGELLTYTLTIDNFGPSDASGVVVTNTLPAEVDIIDATSSTGGDCNGTSIIVCDLDDLGVDSSATITLIVTIDPTIAATVYNTATVSSEVTDPLIANNSKVEQTIVVEKLYVLYFPITHAGPATDEPNDTCEQAYRIFPNTNYRFFPEDQFDWYHFDTTVDGTMTAILSNFKPLLGQIALYKGSNCNNRVVLGNNGDTSMNKFVDAGFQTAGHFYVFVSNDGVLTNQDPYSLVVAVTE